MDKALESLSSSVQFLALNPGLYLITIRSSTPEKVGDPVELTLPAVHVGPGPGAPPGQVEFLTGPRNQGKWLCQPRDMMVVRVATGPANLLITTLRASATAPMDIDVQRLDGRVQAAAAPRAALAPPRANGATPAPSAAPVNREGRADHVRTRVALHLQGRGDIAYVDNFWAGALGERLAIECFAITPLERLRPEDIEYKALSERGEESDWIAGGQDCGSRGLGVALSGFAVRPRSGSPAGFDCEYRGSFSSGKIVGPVRNGVACVSEPGDRLEAIQLFIIERRPGGDAPIEPQARPAPAAAPIGPRFSVFREGPA
jgi:hypothetical protein